MTLDNYTIFHLVKLKMKWNEKTKRKKISTHIWDTQHSALCYIAAPCVLIRTICLLHKNIYIVGRVCVCVCIDHELALSLKSISTLNLSSQKYFRLLFFAMKRIDVNQNLEVEKKTSIDSATNYRQFRITLKTH